MILQDKQLSSKISSLNGMFDPALVYLMTKAGYVRNVFLFLKEK